MSFPRYMAVFLAVAFGVGVLVRYLNATTDSALGSSAQLMVPAMIAALVEGQRFTRRKERKPSPREAWSFAWVATGLAVVMNVGLAHAAPAILPEFGKLAVAPLFSRQFNILLALYAGGYLICNRLFLGIGAGNQLGLMRGRRDIE